MTSTRTFFVVIALAVAGLAATLAGLPATRRSLPALAFKVVEAPAGSRDLAGTLASMRDLHTRMLSAQTDEARRTLLPQSAQLMDDGLALMRELKKGLPTSAAGELVSETISQAEAERIQDFLTLMEWLVQTRDDEQATRQGQLPSRGAVAPPSLV